MDTNEKIKQIIENSGNDFHLEVVEILKSRLWDVEISCYYNDPATDKQREIDIIATKKFPIESFFTGPHESFTLRLFIECKYINKPNVLWFVPKNVEKAKKLSKRNIVLNDCDDLDLYDRSKVPHRQVHYLIEDEVLKLTSEVENQDPFYKGMNGCLNAYIFYTQFLTQKIYKVVNFPIIAINSFENIYKRDNKKGDGYSEINKNFQMEVNYAYLNSTQKSVTEYFLIDILSKDKLIIFLDSLEENDGHILKSKIEWDLRRKTSK